MQSNKFQKLAKKIAIEDKDMFDALMDYEKTGKIVTKTRLNFTIDRGVADKFRKYCRNHNINMSAKVEEMLRQSTK